eukprot:TRINITY_DN6311_c0_g2_i1.p1 TRINITY_DN6311_c0_g2~~TRINITY_DN6311_c0_g2_i1.p1  ORF type:complete len:299 (+),score=46.20 TRINITY_DN6311_c0_g2_i1:199-1095(+)
MEWEEESSEGEELSSEEEPLAQERQVNTRRPADPWFIEKVYAWLCRVDWGGVWAHTVHISMFFLLFVCLGFIGLGALYYGGFDTAKCEIKINRTDYTKRIDLSLFWHHIRERTFKKGVPLILIQSVQQAFDKDTVWLIDQMDNILPDLREWRTTPKYLSAPHPTKKEAALQKKPEALHHVPPDWCPTNPSFIPAINYKLKGIYLMIDVALAGLEVTCFNVLEETREDIKDLVTYFFFFAVEMELRYWELKEICEGDDLRNYYYQSLLEQRGVQINELLEKQGRFQRINNAIRKFQVMR